MRYYKELRSIMEYKDKGVYPRDKVYTDAEVLALTPDDLYKWIYFWVYGTEDPTPKTIPK